MIPLRATTRRTKASNNTALWPYVEFCQAHSGAGRDRSWWWAVVILHPRPRDGLASRDFEDIRDTDCPSPRTWAAHRRQRMKTQLWHTSYRVAAHRGVDNWPLLCFMSIVQSLGASAVKGFQQFITDLRKLLVSLDELGVVSVAVQSENWVT